MPYDAVSAYTVVLGEGDGSTSVTVHGSADEAWAALDAAVRARTTRWLPRTRGDGDVATIADRWRDADPQRRFWQVSSHRLQVMVPTSTQPPTAAAKPTVDPAPPTPAVGATALRSRSGPRRAWRRPA